MNIKPTDRLYLAYGANTNRAHMRHRCPTAKFVGVVVLEDHALVFRSVADVVPRRGSTVECALWTLQPADEASLDRFEGVPTLYCKREADMTVGDLTVRALYYQMTGHRPDQFEPGASYEATLREGYKACGMPISQIDKAIAEARRHPRRERRYKGSWTGKKPTDATGNTGKQLTLPESQPRRVWPFPKDGATPEQLSAAEQRDEQMRLRMQQQRLPLSTRLFQHWESTPIRGKQ